MRRAQQAGTVRTDLNADVLTRWVLLLLDGYLARLAVDPACLCADRERTLSDSTARLLAAEASGIRPVLLRNCQSRRGPDKRDRHLRLNDAHLSSKRPVVGSGAETVIFNWLCWGQVAIEGNREGT